MSRQIFRSGLLQVVACDHGADCRIVDQRVQPPGRHDRFVGRPTVGIVGKIGAHTVSVAEA